MVKYRSHHRLAALRPCRKYAHASSVEPSPLLRVVEIWRHQAHPASAISTPAIFESMESPLVGSNDHHDTTLESRLSDLTLHRVDVDTRILGRAVAV
jgi:hypothetical protein